MHITIPTTVAVSDSGFVFLSSTGETFTLNEVGRFIYRQLHEHLELDQIARHIAEEYDVDRNSLEKDVSEFIEQLHVYGLIERR